MISRAHPGDKILPAYNALVDEVRKWRYLLGAGVRLMETPVGTIVIREPESVSWNHAWKVSLSGGACVVAPGRINTDMAYLAGRPLDNLDPDGNPLDGPIPVLPCKTRHPADQWIVLRARVDAEWKFRAAKFQSVEITESATWLAGYSVAIADEDNDGWQGDFPLALLRGSQVWQIAHFHVRCRVQQVSEGRGRFWFFV